jgi:uncharacterized protein
MKINVSSILRSINSSKEIDGHLEIPLIKYNGDEILVNTPVHVDAVITNMENNLIITGKFNAELRLKCSRCLEYFNLTIESDFEEQLSNKDEDEDEDVILFEGDTIDLTDIVINNILLSLPMKAVCNDDCLGLCPHCGSNKNIVKCQCINDSLDPRLTVLKDLLKED